MNKNYYYHPDTGFKAGISAQELEAALKDERAVLWVDVSEIDDNDIDLLTRIFNLHFLTVEDFIMPNARPKVEEFPDYLFLVIFFLHSAGKEEKHRVHMTEFNCCLGKNFLITYHVDEADFVSGYMQKIARQAPASMRGADTLLHSMLDLCVDNYFPLLNEFDRLADEMSDELFGSPDQNTLKKIYYIKNDIMHLRRIIGPQAEVLGQFTRGTIRFIQPQNSLYFRNVYDNMMRFNDTLSSLRDTITSAMEAYVSIISNRLNEVMKTLTVIATIVMPLTLIASIYGMNFKHMPELESKAGYPTVITIMVVLAVFMLMFFKRKKWL